MLEPNGDESRANAVLPVLTDVHGTGYAPSIGIIRTGTKGLSQHVANKKATSTPAWTQSIGGIVAVVEHFVALHLHTVQTIGAGRGPVHFL